MTDIPDDEATTKSDPVKNDDRRAKYPEHLLLYTLDQVAEILSISRSHAYRMKKGQSWPHLKLGTEIRFSETDIEAILALNRQVAAPAVKQARNTKIGSEAARRRAHNYNIRHGLKETPRS